MYTYLKFGLPRVMPPGVEEVGVHSVPIRAGDPGVAAWCHHGGTTHPWPPVGHLEVTFRSPGGQGWVAMCPACCRALVPLCTGHLPSFSHFTSELILLQTNFYADIIYLMFFMVKMSNEV